MSEDLKIKTASGKPVLSLVPLTGLVGVARVAEYGAEKYARGNWFGATDDGAPERYLSAALRHLAQLQNLDATVDWQSIAEKDAESGQFHLDHAICGLVYLRVLATRQGALPEDPGATHPPESK